MATFEQLQREIEGMKSTLLIMESRLEELEGGTSTGSVRTGGAILSDAEKVLYIREAVRRDMRGDGAMRKAFNRRNAPQGNHKGLPLQRGGDKRRGA